jgi:6-phosphogluconolactonase
VKEDFLMIETILLGTYTKQTSKGIYQVELDTEAKKLQNLALVAEVENPTYLTRSSKNIAYAVDRYQDQGGLSVINLDAPAKVLQHLVKPGTPPAYVTVDENQQLVFDANYHAGTLSAYKINDDQTLTLAHTFTNTGSGPLKEQDGSHLHYIDRTPDGKLIACDLGTDQVFILDYTDDGFTVISEYQTTPGFGPRHVTFNNDGTVAYLVGELSSNVEVLTYENQKLSHVQTIKTIPDDWSEHNGDAAIRITNDNQFLYVSNRGFDSIAVFAIQADGTLKLIQNISVEGSFPRDFNLNQDETFLVCGNQTTNNLTLFERNPIDGKLKLIQKDFAAPEVVCVYFK